MRESESPRDQPAAARLPGRLLARELGRLATAVGIYLVLRPVWTWTGLRAVYRAVVVGSAERVVLLTQHFPLLSGLSNLTTHNIDFVVLLAIALFLVSLRVPWRTRLLRFGLALAVILAIQVLAFVVWVEMTAAQELEASRGILVLLPGEFRILDAVKYLLYDFGQPATMFALLLLTVIWNTGLSIGAPAAAGREPTPRARGAAASRLAVLGLVLVLAAAAIPAWKGWTRAREADPRHVDAHAKLGHAFWEKGDRATAGQQYRTAVAGGTRDPEVFYNLAGIAAASGRLDEARRLLQRCLDLSVDPAWAKRVEHALGALRAPPMGERLRR